MRDDQILRLRCEVIAVALHPVEVGGQQGNVSGGLVLLPWHDHERRAPLRRIAEAAAENGIFRSDVRHEAIVELGLGHVAHALDIHRDHIPLVAECVAVEVVLLEPCEFLPMRAVRDHAHQVAALRPADEGADAVEQFVRALEVAGGLRLAVHDHAFQFCDFWQRLAFRRAQLDLQVTPAAVEELGKPCLARGFAFEGVGVERFAAAHRIVDPPVFVEHFGGNHFHRRTGDSFHFQAGHERGVLPEVADPEVGADLVHLRCLQCFDRTNGSGSLGQSGQRPARAFGECDWRPGAVVIEPFFQACVVIFASVNAGEGDRTVGASPGFIADDRLLGAVLKADAHLQGQHRLPEGPGQLDIASAGDIEEAVAEHHP